jgi:hypothetical protein
MAFGEPLDAPSFRNSSIFNFFVTTLDAWRSNLSFVDSRAIGSFQSAPGDLCLPFEFPDFSDSRHQHKRRLPKLPKLRNHFLNFMPTHFLMISLA